MRNFSLLGRLLVSNLIFLSLVIAGCSTSKLPARERREAPTQVQAYRSVAAVEGQKRLSAEELKAIFIRSEQTTVKANPLTGMPFAFEQLAQTLPSGAQASEGSRTGYLVRRPNYGVFFAENGISATFLDPATVIKGEESSDRAAPVAREAISLSFLGNARSIPASETQLKGVAHNIHGTNKTAWRKAAPLFGGVQYKGLYRDTDLHFFGEGYELHYGFEIGQKGSPDRIRFKVSGSKSLKLLKNGDLQINTARGPLFLLAPEAFEEMEGKKLSPLKVSYRVVGRDIISFSVSGRKAGSRVFIDPVLVFSTYFGGTGQEGMLGTDDGAAETLLRGFDLSVTASGTIFLTGMTTSADFPVTTGTDLNGNADIFAIRLDPTSTPNLEIAYATFIGGSSTERARGISATPDGSVYICGHTNSADFPVSADGVQGPRPAAGGYLLKLDPTGLFARGTFVGSNSNYHPNAVVFEPSNSQNSEASVYVVGSASVNATTSMRDSTEGAFQRQSGGESDAFVASFNADLTRLNYLTFLGGAGRDSGMALAVSDGFAFITGATSSVNFPTTEFAAHPTHSLAEAFDQCTPTSRECFDAYVARINRSGSDLVYSTYYGGQGEDYARGIAVDSQKRAFITGGSVNRQGSGATEIFVTKIESLGGSVLSETFIPSEANDHGEAVAVDAQGRAHVVGVTRKAGQAVGIFPVQSEFGGNRDMFYARVQSGGQLDHFTYLGGSRVDEGFAVDILPTGNADDLCVFMAGVTSSEDLSTSNAFQPAPASSAPDMLFSVLCDIPFNPGNPGSFIKTASTGAVVSGQVVTFTVQLTNSSDGTAPGVVLLDSVPNQFTVVGATGPGCSFQGNVVRCTMDVAPGTTTVTIFARAESRCGTNVTNTATVAVAGFDSSTSASVFIQCPPPTQTCGDNRREGSEQCDDGNQTPGDGCRADCSTEVCGDGIRDQGEGCDDGNRANNDNCSNGCQRQLPPGASCARGGDPCRGALVCGVTCSVVHDCWPNLFGWCPFGTDAYELCTLPECIPNGRRVRVVGQ